MPVDKTMSFPLKVPSGLLFIRASTPAAPRPHLTFQIIALGALILGQGLPQWNVMIVDVLANVPHTVGLITLWAAAILTVMTGWDYLRVGLKHMD